jgi:hypothetical protein
MSKKYTSLPPLQVQVINLLNRNPTAQVSTFELRRHGIASPSQAISKLKRRGADIERQLRPATDEAGVMHDRVAHYSLKGWL